MKAVIPAAGLGTRMLPATKTVPKELLAIIDKPILQFVIQEAHTAKIDEIIIIVNQEKKSIKQYLHPDPRLDTQLKKIIKIHF